MTTIRLAEDGDRPKWDAFVKAHEEFGPFVCYAWKQAVEKAYHHRTYYLMCEDDGGTVQGVLPLIFVKPPLFRGTLVSLPFCDYGGVLTNGADSTSMLIDHALVLASSIKARLEVRCQQPQPGLASRSLGVISHKVRMLLDLPENSDILWNGFKSKLRSQIKRPQKDGLTFNIGGLDLCDDFYQVFRVNMRDLGSPIHSRAWISAISECFGNNARIGIVYDDQKPVAAGIILTCQDTVTIPWASALNEYNRSSPNMLLYWGFLQYACDNGFKRFDFGRSSPGEGTFKFKEQWGSAPVPLYWYGEGFSDEEIPAITQGRLRQEIAKTWSRLPQGLVDKAGPIIRRYITL